MKRMTMKSEHNYNLLYDPEAIEYASFYLMKNNKAVDKLHSEWIEYISDYMTKQVAKLAKLYYTDPDWETKWTTFSGTAGFVFIFTIADVTKNGYPVIEADCYVTPNIGKSGVIETKYRSKSVSNPHLARNTLA